MAGVIGRGEHCAGGLRSSVTTRRTEAGGTAAFLPPLRATSPGSRSRLPRGLARPAGGAAILFWMFCTAVCSSAIWRAQPAPGQQFTNPAPTSGEAPTEAPHGRQTTDGRRNRKPIGPAGERGHEKRGGSSSYGEPR
jgi:hypothetical protein